ncbi:hypothetical protein MKS88_002277 [Plasmodium brasilianum]|uniref:Uncharacterized protein n=1 Tax=Plasmodium brasilianum TaxID=5824 RepID=A0ACB9YAX3_PLABR|nr:hypothetical protein MKS88_002277 [Plasmodium brasilianum]
MYSNEKEYYDESGLLNYDSNDDVLIKNEELCSYMLQSGDELDKKSEKEKMNYSNINKGEEQHIDFLLTSIAFNIPLGFQKKKKKEERRKTCIDENNLRVSASVIAPIKVIHTNEDKEGKNESQQIDKIDKIRRTGDI